MPRPLSVLRMRPLAIFPNYVGHFNQRALNQERNEVRAAYVHLAQHMQERRRMMQWWSNYLELNKDEFHAPYDLSGINIIN